MTVVQGRKKTLKPFNEKCVHFMNDSTTPILGFGGGIGGAKTLTMVIKIINWCQSDGLERILVIRRDYPKLRDSIMQLFWDWWPETKDWFNVERSEIIFPNGAVIHFRHGSDESDFFGPSYTKICVDQMEELPEKIFWYLLGRMRDSELTTQFCFTFNYVGEYWVYNLFKVNQDYLDAKDSRGDPDLQIIETTTEENK